MVSAQVADLKTIRREKMKDDVTFTIEAPEELHYWTLNNPWKQKFFNDRSVHLMGIKVDSKQQKGKLSTITFSSKAPLRLQCGVDVCWGQKSSIVKDRLIAEFRIDGAIDLREAMNQLSDMAGETVWEIIKLEVYNSDKGATLYFQKFSPNNTGSSLFLKWIEQDGKKRRWDKVLLNEQQRVVGKFRHREAHCTFIEETIVKPQCAMKKGIKSSQIKRRPRKK